AGAPNVCRTTAASLLTDQRRKVRSVPAVANREPDRATAIALTAPAWPVNVLGRSWSAKSFGSGTSATTGSSTCGAGGLIGVGPGFGSVFATSGTRATGGGSDSHLWPKA